MNKKSDIKSKLEIKTNSKKENIILKKNELSEAELELKNKLLQLNSKIDSIYTVLTSIENEKCTTFSDDIIYETIEILSSSCLVNILSDFLTDES